MQALRTFGARIALLATALAAAIALPGCGGGTDHGADRAARSTPSAAALAAPAKAVSRVSAPLVTGRSGHTATLLRNGLVLVAGGTDATRSLSTCELYDPVNDRWRAAAPMLEAHQDAQAVLLADGRVLMSGGHKGTFGGTDTIAGHEIYDPVSNRWSAAAAPVTPRLGHTATVLANGRVLVTGGVEPQNYGAGFNYYLGITSAEIYDPVANRWGPAASLPQARRSHTAARLADGRVLVAGFNVGHALGNEIFSMGGGIDLYDPATNRWSTITNMIAEASWGLVAALPNGKVLVPFAVLDVASRQWTTTQGVASDRPPNAPFVMLPDGRVITAGGGWSLNWAYGRSTSARQDVFTPGGARWGRGRSLGELRTDHTLTLLANGEVLVVGGRSEYDGTTVLRSAERLVPGEAPRALAAAGDLDGDGKSDLLWRNKASGEVTWWRMQGVQRLAAATVRGPGAATLVGRGDTNGDGRADLAWYTPATDLNELWLMNGPVATRKTVVGMGSGQRSILLDLDGDDRADLLSLTPDANPGVLREIPDPNAPTLGWDWGTNPAEQLVATGDFDRDGRTDLVMHDSRDGSTAIWPMVGYRWTGRRVLLPLGPTQSVVGAADLDGNGSADLLVRDNTNGSVAAWLMDGTRVLQARTILTAPGWKLAGTPDLNGDGKADLTWYRAATGETHAWLMNGLATVQGAVLLTNAAWEPIGP